MLGHSGACAFLAPLPLTKTSPADAATGLGTSVTLSWTSTLSNVAYWVCWGPTATGTTCPLSGGWAPNGASPSKAVANLAPGTYYWQVRAQTAAGFVEGDAGTWWAFTVGSAPEEEAEPAAEADDGAHHLGGQRPAGSLPEIAGGGMRGWMPGATRESRPRPPTATGRARPQLE